ncbi:MFS transporter [Apibacter muscae]|uniref:MFS transporter n=1 Tax=Apibacter muscae TaxID=2509004 RepID=UPI0011AB9B78|nr:MFS transporter [Apibacter muscae]TWP25225.1 MFS transporter [Apibacter muscae]
MLQKKMVDMDHMPLRWGHVKIFFISSLGQALGAGLATLIGIIIPMIQMLIHPELNSFSQGIISCMSLLGIVVGSSLIGDLSDKHGYLKLFRICPLLILGASLFAFFFDHVWILAFCLFLMGIGIGGEYSLGSDYISEIMPDRWKLFMVGAAKSTSAIGSIVVATISYFLLIKWQNPMHWNFLLLLISALSLLMFLLRIRFAQSPGWLIAHAQIEKAEIAVKYFLGNDVKIGDIKNKPVDTKDPNLKDFLSKDNLKKVIFSGIPWACEGLGVYGLGIFLPILVLALGLEPSKQDPFDKIISSVKITTFINVFVLIGFILGLFIVNKINHLKIQVWGFSLSSLGLILLLVGYKLGLSTWIFVLGFLIFELFLNAGPHLMTFIIPPQIYSIEERGTGVGLAASIGKIGAVIAVFFIPNLLKWGGIELVLIVSILVNLLGAFITQYYGRKIPEINKN